MNANVQKASLLTNRLLPLYLLFPNSPVPTTSQRLTFQSLNSLRNFFGTAFYVKDNGEDVAIENTIEAVRTPPSPFPLPPLSFILLFILPRLKILRMT